SSTQSESPVPPKIWLGEPTSRDAAMAVDWPEYGTVFDLRRRKPGFERPDRAMDSPTERNADLAPHPFLAENGGEGANFQRHPRNDCPHICTLCGIIAWTQGSHRAM